MNKNEMIEKDYENLRSYCFSAYRKTNLNYRIEFEDFFNIYKTSFKTLKEYTVFVSLHSKKEFDFLEELKKKSQSEENLKIFTSFAIHPQNPSLEEFDFLEFLLKNKKITHQIRRVILLIIIK